MIDIRVRKHKIFLGIDNCGKVLAELDLVARGRRSNLETSVRESTCKTLWPRADGWNNYGCNRTLRFPHTCRLCGTYLNSRWRSNRCRFQATCTSGRCIASVRSIHGTWPIYLHRRRTERTHRKRERRRDHLWCIIGWSHR